MEGMVAAYPVHQSSRTLLEAQLGTSYSIDNRGAGTRKEKGAAVRPRVGTHKESEATSA